MKHAPSRAIALVIVAGLTAAGAGCGSSDDDGPSKAEFVKSADAICAKGSKAIDAAGKKVLSSGKPTKPRLRAFVVKTVIPNIRKQVADIDRLEAPEGDEDAVQAITDAANASLEKVEADPQLALGAGSSDPFSRANRLSKAYGLKVCAAT